MGEYLATLTDYRIHAEYLGELPNYPKNVSNTTPKGFSGSVNLTSTRL